MLRQQILIAVGVQRACVVILEESRIGGARAVAVAAAAAAGIRASARRNDQRQIAVGRPAGERFEQLEHAFGPRCIAAALRITCTKEGITLYNKWLEISVTGY